jgi:hypothetical protein
MTASRPHHTLGLLRLALLGVLVLAVSITLLARRATAAGKDALFELGEHLSALAEAGMGREQRRVLINGEALGFRVFLSPVPRERILDAYEGWCRHGAGAFEEEEARLAQAERSPVHGDESWRDLTVRLERPSHAVVACLRHGLANPSPGELAERVRRFLDTGNLAALGRFHYVLVQERGEQRRVVCVWSEGDFYPLRMFPENGDAPGPAAPGLLRPRGSRRLLSAAELGVGASLTVFVDGEESIASLSERYRRHLASDGWRLREEEEASADGSRVLIADAGEITKLVYLERDEQGRSVAVVAVQGGEVEASSSILEE